MKTPLAILLGFVALPLVADESPRLAVVISIDQFRADYLDRFRPFFGEDGFNCLVREGASFRECHHRHAVTATAPGHATLLTGVHADVHGIVANDWIRRTDFAMIGSVEDPDSPVIGAALKVVGKSPKALLADTVGDQLKLRYGKTGKVVSMANKDRAAIFMGGKAADAAYWMEHGRFVTSKYYMEKLPAWVEGFNAEGRVERDFGREWTWHLPREEYDRVQGPDDAPGEESRLGLGTTFPRRVDGGAKEITPKFYEAYRLAPFSTQLLADFAVLAIASEQLGQDGVPDLLCIGFSQPDYAGHSYGPDSHEIMDSVIMVDRAVAQILKALDERVGRGRYLVVLTSDHGVAPLPERVGEHGLESGRFEGPASDQAVESALDAAFGPRPSPDLKWTVRDAYGYHLRTGTLQATKTDYDAAVEVLKKAVLTLPTIAKAYTRKEMLAIVAEGDSVPARVRRSFHPERSQDVVHVFKPFYVDRFPAGDNHGTPYDYDDHVPLVWYGAGVTPAVRIERIGSDDLAPTLSALLAVDRPAQSRGNNLFKPVP